MSGPQRRLRDNITSATALVVIGLGILGAAFGVPYFWLIFVLGLLVIVPLVGLIFGADDWKKWDPLSDEFWEDIFGEEEEDTVSDQPPIKEVTKQDALAILRDRYARGELTDEQFERKLELLLETEVVEDIEDRFIREKE